MFLFDPPGLKPISGVEAWRDEFETAAAWNRPVRKYHSDTPYYPWAPKPQFSVSFKLGWK